MSITHIDFLLRIFSENKDNNAIIWNNDNYTYNWLYNKIIFYNTTLFENVLAKGSVVVLKGDITPNTISILLSLIYNNCIIIPLTFEVIFANFALAALSYFLMAAFLAFDAVRSYFLRAATFLTALS